MNRGACYFFWLRIRCQMMWLAPWRPPRIGSFPPLDCGGAGGAAGSSFPFAVFCFGVAFLAFLVVGFTFFLLPFALAATFTSSPFFGEFCVPPFMSANAFAVA